MGPRLPALLHDVKQAVGLLASFLAGKSFDDYLRDALLRSAVERQLEIIGESLNQLTKIDAACATKITDSRRIIALRNILIHAYAKVDHRVVWNILDRHLPVLRREVDALLQGLEQDT